MGLDSIGEAADLRTWDLRKIASRFAKKIAPEAERRILAVTCAVAKDGVNVDAKPSRRRIAQLREEGYNTAQIASAARLSRATLNSKTSCVTVRTAYRIELAYQRLTA